MKTLKTLRMITFLVAVSAITVLASSELNTDFGKNNTQILKINLLTKD